MLYSKSIYHLTKLKCPQSQVPAIVSCFSSFPKKTRPGIGLKYNEILQTEQVNVIRVLVGDWDLSAPQMHWDIMTKGSDTRVNPNILSY